ncbi:transposase [Corynebacterium liangguodongii]|uniref:transposase n=1 Tax=Corynebacterium liangguodongii TaxID=2079535 RepID=UPI0018EEC73A
MSNTRSRFRVLTDQQRETIEPLLPGSDGRRGRPFRTSRLIVERIIYRYRTDIPWRVLPREEYGPWQTVWKRHRRYRADGTIDWKASVDAWARGGRGLARMRSWMNVRFPWPSSGAEWPPGITSTPWLTAGPSSSTR